MTTGKNALKSRLSQLALVVGLATAGMGAAQAGTTLDFADNTTPATAPLPYTNGTGVYVGGNFIETAPANTDAFAASNEFRMIGADGLVGGGGEKTIVDGNQRWDIADNGVITTTGTDLTPTTDSDGLWQGADFFGQAFGFVNAPTSLTLDFVGGTISVSWANGLMAEWGGTFFPMGDPDAANECNTDGQGCGITLSGELTNVVNQPDGSTTFEFRLFGEHRITPYEDSAGGTAPAAGFGGWNAEWELHGTGSHVPPAGNVPPTADAGPDQTVIEGDLVTLDGSGSTDTDGSIVSYAWVQMSGATSVSLSDPAAIKPTFTAPAAPDVLTFDLTITDDGGDSDTSSVTVTVAAPQPPVADAGADQTVTEADLVTLDGSGSTDPDGSIVSYNWTQTSGTGVTLSDQTIVTPTFTAPAPDTLVFSLIVTDDQDLMDTASTTVTVEPAAGADDLNARNDTLITDIDVAGTLNVLLNDSGDGTLNVSASDSSTHRGGTVNCTPTGDCTYNAPSAGFSGTDSFAYTASDSSGSDTATVFITVGSVPADGTVLSFHNRGVADQQQRYSLEGGVYSPDGTFAPLGDAFDDAFATNSKGANSEFRMIQPTSAVAGGGEKSAAGKRDDGTGSDQDIFQWIFDATGGLENSTGLIDTDPTPVVPQDTPNSDAAISTVAIFFEGGFAFQLLGPGNVTLDFANNIIAVAWPQGLNAHWAGRFFPLGEPEAANQCNTDGQGCGITMRGPMMNVVTIGGQTTFDFKLFGEYRITPFEDTERDTNVGAGFKGWRPQWELDGSGAFTGAIEALESPSVDNGTIGPTPGGPADGNSFDDGRVSRDELTAADIPADDGVEQDCIGSCFDVTVTGVTNPSVRIVLPLSAAIVGENPTYRKFSNDAWRDFDTSGGDTVESAILASGGTCAALGDADWQAGLIDNSNCVRLTIKDGGSNDADGTVNGEVQDPGGVGIPLSGGEQISSAPSDSIGSGCSIASTSSPVGSNQRGDWWILAGFLAWVGVLAGRRGRRLH